MQFGTHLFSKNKLLFIYLLIIWFITNIVQAIFTEIGNDEAYYWLYSQHLAWGYFDHPPMVALLIKLGSYLFSNELGVRFFTIISQLLFLIICFKLAGEKVSKSAILLFFTVAASIIMLQAYGFVTTPDGSMLLFSLFFLLAYKNFIEANNWQNTVLIGISMALLIYSKYHGVLFIAFVVLSNIKLFLNFRFYLAALLAILLLLPHIIWQHNNGYVSFAFHFVQRSSYFDINNLFEFFGNQLVVFNPLTLGALAYVLAVRKIDNLFERALVFIIGGFFIFFTLSCLKGYVNPHWTVAVSGPMIILIVREAMVNEKLKRFVFRWIAPSLLLIVAMRVFLIFDILPISTEWHGDKKKMIAIGEAAGNKPVIFTNRFQEPSKYMFYTNKPVHSLSSVTYRNTQFNIWDFDLNFRGDTIFLLSGPSNPKAVKYTNRTNEIYLLPIPDYQPFNKLITEYDTTGIVFARNKEIKMPVSITNPYLFNFELNHATMPISFNVVVSNKQKVFHTINTLHDLSDSVIISGASVKGTVTFTIPNEYTGTYRFWLCHKPDNFSNYTTIPNKLIKIE